MNKFVLTFLVSFSLILTNSLSSKSQIVTFNTVTQGIGTVYGNNGQNGITFVIQNTNGFPAVLTEVGNYFTGTGTTNAELWYSATSLSGLPGAVNALNGWTQISNASVVINNGSPFNATVGTYNSLFTGLTFVIPANTTYRFFLGSSVTMEYTGTTNPTGAIPVNFTNTGVNLQIGEHLIGGNFVGYGGGVAGPTFNPRAFTGGVTLNLLSTPCAGTPTAGTSVAVPTNPCPGNPVALSLTGVTSAANLTFQWWRSTTGLPGTWIPLAGGTTNPFNVTPTTGSTNFYRCVVTCTNSSLFDTSIVVGPVTTQPWSPTSPCYCGTSTATSNLNSDIFNVSMGSLNNTTDCVNPLIGTQGTGTGTPSQNANFTNITAPFIYVGLSQNFSMTLGSCATNSNTGAKLYIDYNQNSVFTDPGEEVYFSGLTAIPTSPATILNGSFTVPPTALPGLTRMRFIAQINGHLTATTITPCGSYTQGETEDYLVNIIPPAQYDPGITAITTPNGNCFTANQVLTAQLCNFGSTPIDLSVNPVTVTLNLNGPNGLVQYTTTVNTGLLNPYGASCVTALFTGVNMYTGGTYLINTSLTIAGITNGNLFNDSLQNPITKINFRPAAGAPYQLCQFSPIPFGQGLVATGCAAPLTDSVTITFNITPTMDNMGATGNGTSLNAPANCSNIFAGNLGNAVLPVLPVGAYFTQNAKLEVTNMASTGRTQARFILYGSQLFGPGLYAGCPTGFNVGANNILIGGLSLGTAALFNNYRDITPAQLSNMFGVGGTVNLGYWETFNSPFAASDVTFDVSGPTTATLKVYYSYIPTGFSWFNTPSGGINLSSLTPFNPIITTGSGITNSNTTGTYIFYAACSSSPTCRVPVNLVINPTPQAFQDTISVCEYAVSSNTGIFDLTTLNASVSGNNALASVDYYLDEPLFSLVPTPNDDSSSTNFIYSKVFYPATGCYSSDSVLLQVNSLPEFPNTLITGFACAPNAIDVATLINPFSTTPVGTDTLYYEDAAYTMPHPNPHNITSADTVYMVFATNTNPVCSDTALAYIDIVQANNFISGQPTTPPYYSNAGNFGCTSFTLTDGNADTLRSSVDCKRIASVTDIANSTSLGLISVCQDIAASTPYHNGQPYVNRAYQITAANSDTAMVCLYYLDQDFQDYNADAGFTGWPLLPVSGGPANLSNIAITKVDNGDLNTPGHTAIAIPNSAINASYDPSSTVWTICFPVSGFSYFYLHTQNPVNAPLPVTILSFTGKSIDGTSQLNWVTASEQNNSHFVVERSKDGRAFSTLSNAIKSKAINGNSESPLDYGYTDATPFQGHNYYRLQQHDIDGKISYSKVLDVYFGNETMVTLYPNPVNSIMNVDISTPKATSATLKVTDATGRVVKVVSMQLSAGANTTQVDLQGLADGIYMVHITNGKGLDYAQPVRKN